MKKVFSLFSIFCLLFSVFAGCGPTYPKESFKESILRVCKSEYKLDVKVETIGKTVAIYLPLENLLDVTFAITKKASEEINDVILSVSRVALSTDAKYDFYCIIAHDIRIPEIQIVIIKSVEDVKRFMLNDIARSEYSKRMLVDMRLSPQAQKERAIKEVFEKMSVDKRWQEDVMNDFFRSEPTALGDIGYWDGRFYIKDVTLPEFLAEQMANRIRMEFREDKKLSEEVSVRAAKGTYTARPKDSYFKIDITAEPKWFKEAEGDEASMKIFDEVFKVAAHVLHAYRFENFAYVEVTNQAYHKSARISRENLELLRTKKAKFEAVADYL